MMRKMKCFGALAGCVLATGALYATDNATYSETFEGDSTWAGGTPTVSNYTFSATAGLPVSGSALPSGNKVLVIEGNASYTASGMTGSPIVDMMVQTARPEDELGFPSSETTSDIQIAVAVDSNGYFNAYCKNKSDVVGWYQITTNAADASGWARVSFVFDYTYNRCQIRINGEPIMTANGYLTSSTTDGTSVGAWYKLANDPSSDAVSSMKVIGCTAIDEVAMNNTGTYALATTADTDGVPYAWYDANGIAWDADGSYDGSGMTAKQKYNACLSPTDGEKLEVKSVSVGNETMTVTIPQTIATTGRKVVLDYGDTTAFGNSVEVTGNATPTLDLPANGAVKYFRLRATTASQQ